MSEGKCPRPTWPTAIGNTSLHSAWTGLSNTISSFCPPPAFPVFYDIDTSYASHGNWFCPTPSSGLLRHYQNSTAAKFLPPVLDSPIVPSNLPSVRSWFKVEIQEADSNSFVCRSLENVATGGVKRVIVRVSRAAEVAACPGTSTRVEMFARLSCRKNQRNRLEHDKGEPSSSSTIAILFKYAHLHDNSQASDQTQTTVS